MSDENQKDSPNNPNPAESDRKELSENELKDVSGGRITNIRVNANGITGGGPVGPMTVTTKDD